MKLFGKKGFTLIELMLVVGIIMVLASLVMVSVSKSRARGRDGKRIADLSTIQLAMEMYKDSNGVYPSSYGPWANSMQSGAGTYWANLQGTLTNYLYPIPKDPINKNNYRYEIYSGMDYTMTPNTYYGRYYIRTRVEDKDNATEITAGDPTSKTWCYYVIGGAATDFYGSGDSGCQ
ncbi:MAG: type II secretion system GspH family protein [Patescibacteria group bacterium]|nr:type II secretion system GspH family protein [Patescibacteria group bacterium]